MKLNEQVRLISEEDFSYIIKHGKRLDINKEKFLGKKLKSFIYLPYKLVKSTIPSNLSEGNISELMLNVVGKKKI